MYEKEMLQKSLIYLSNKLQQRQEKINKDKENPEFRDISDRPIKIGDYLLLATNRNKTLTLGIGILVGLTKTKATIKYYYDNDHSYTLDLEVKNNYKIKQRLLKIDDITYYKDFPNYKKILELNNNE